jgi:hypothetical protein
MLNLMLDGAEWPVSHSDTFIPGDTCTGIDRTSGFWYKFFHLCATLIFTLLLLFIVYVFGLIDYLQAYQMAFQGNCYCCGFFFKLVMCCRCLHIGFMVLLVEFSCLSVWQCYICSSGVEAYCTSETTN